MILSDREIQAALHRGSIKITPMPPAISTPGAASPWSSTTLDLKLDTELTEWVLEDSGADVKFLPPDDPKFNFDVLTRKICTGVSYTGRRACDEARGVHPGLDTREDSTPFYVTACCQG